MKINGKTQTVILFRVYDGGAARIALENETLELAYATKRLSDREKELFVLSEPDALEFGAGGKGRAFFAAGWQTDPATGKRAWTIPCLACGVKSVAHDQDEAEAASLRRDRERRQRERLERERIDQAAATEAAQRRRQEQDDLRAIAASVGKLDPATAGGAQSGTGKRGRARQDVTQSEAAALCGVTLKTVQRWDRGEGTPEGYTGRGDAVTLRAWAARRKEAAAVKRALKNTVHVDCQKLSESARWQADMKRRGAAGRRQGDW
jgi:DNA-binding transcriptional MerR regulator